MHFNKFMAMIQVSPTQKNKLLKRYQKLGIEIKESEINEEDADRILRDYSETANLNEYITNAIVNMNMDVNVNVIRATADIRCRLLSEGYPVKKFSDTTFSVTPNTYYISKEYLPDVNRVIDEYCNSLISGELFQIRIKQIKPAVEKILSPEEQKINEQKENLIGIVDFLCMHPGWENFSRKVNHREKALCYLEDNEWFGLERVSIEEIVFEKIRKNPYYIWKKDIPFLDQSMKRFFDEYGLSSDQILSGIVENTERKDTMRKFVQFLDERNKDMWDKEEKNIRPHVNEVAWILSESEKELSVLITEEVAGLIKKVTTEIGKTLLISFINWLRESEEVNYQKIIPVEMKSSQVNGYSREQYQGLCYLFFSTEHIKKSCMVEKALKDNRCAGMWMYHSVLAIMDLRGADIEAIVKFPDILSDINWLKDVPREANRLEEFILLDKIKEETYVKIGKWFIDGFTYYEVPVHKTNLGEVTGRITPELLAHFGKLFLIGEVHHLQGEEKFLNIQKWGSGTYCSHIFMARFYGKEVYQILGRYNFQRLKMNHTVSQMEQKVSHDMGMDGYTAITIASYSRGHSNVSTMFHYVGDHSLTGETAEVVLWLMLERKVLGVVPYLTLLTYFPDSFGKLSAKEQTELIEFSGLSAMDIEALMTHKNQMVQFKEAMIMGDIEDPVIALKALLSIGQGYGASMDNGCFCLKRALGYKCDQKSRSNCLTIGCKYEVLTAEVLPTLINLILDNTKRARAGEAKAAAVLKCNLYPNFVKVRHYLKNILSETVFNYIDGNMKTALGVTKCS